ncbi:MAG: indole-3-glycerol phosphate synthase, partial [Chloroflexota bacterium]|nr:indole-3-glycerol phosphate synthase [Chloroflexota bacterium]
MTIATRSAGARSARTSRSRAGGVVAEIAARRLADLAPELAALSRTELARAAAAAPPPRDLVERLARPGLHLIAEVKRRSPSAGAIVGPDDDPVRRARAYERGGASAISVLCEPHWFGGSIADLTAVRTAVGVPVLAKEFIVDPRQLALLRAAGADAVLLLAVLHPARRLSALVDAALDLGLEPLVEAHDARELERALGTRARVVGINNRDLRTLEVDPERAVRLHELVPGDRIAVAESGVREPATVAGWRAVGFDAALVGEALMRSLDPAAAARAFVAAGASPVDPAVADRIPLVKICGITDPPGVEAAVRAGADAIGLNLVPGTPRALVIEEAIELARLARAIAPAVRRPLIVAVTADAGEARLAEIVAAVDPDAVQLNGSEPPELVRRVARPTWKVLHLPAAAPEDLASPVAAAVALGRAFLAAGAERLLLDTAGGPYPGGTGTRVASPLAAAVARELPVILAGGLDPGNVADAVLGVPALGVVVASGVERPRP